MTNKMKNGTLIIAEGTVVPDELKLESHPYAESWRIVTNYEGYGLNRHLSRAGWTFLYMAQELKVTAFGFATERTFRKAFTTILKKLHSPKFNCLEIIEATPRRFLGFPYVSVSGHARLIQQR